MSTRSAFARKKEKLFANALHPPPPRVGNINDFRFMILLFSQDNLKDVKKQVVGEGIVIVLVTFEFASRFGNHAIFQL